MPALIARNMVGVFLVDVIKAELDMLEAQLRHILYARFVEHGAAGGNQVAVEPGLGSMGHKLFQVLTQGGLAA